MSIAEAKEAIDKVETRLELSKGIDQLENCLDSDSGAIRDSEFLNLCEWIKVKSWLIKQK